MVLRDMMGKETCNKLRITRRCFLKEIQQESPDIIMEDVNVGEDYGIGR